MRAISESDHLGWDTMFDRGLHAIVRSLIVEKVEQVEQPQGPRPDPTPGTCWPGELSGLPKRFGHRHRCTAVQLRGRSGCRDRRVHQ